MTALLYLAALMETTAPSPTVGTLILAGGGTTTTAMVEAFAEAVGDRSRPVAVLAQTRDNPSESGRGSVELLLEHGFKEVVLIGDRRFTAARQRDIEAELNRVAGIWIPGGDQELFMARWGIAWGQPLLRRLHRRGVAFFGTSAGAMLAGQPMIVGAMSDGTAKLRSGLGLWPVIVDSHYRERSRQARLRGAVNDVRNGRGLGLDRGEWVVVEDGEVSRVYGTPESIGVPLPER